MASIIEPRVLKGFRDFLPADQGLRERLIDGLKEVFRAHGFLPIDTPILEYTEVLLGKGGGETDKQVYRFEDKGGRDVAMRFDLTVPFARYMAGHLSELYLPFRRYHIDKVFRGENTQRGRYREFMQCDFDIVGTTTVSSDFEIVLLIALSVERLGVEEYHIHISHRGVFNHLLRRLGVEERSGEILRAVDKLGKIGRGKTKALLTESVGEMEAEEILEYIGTRGSYLETLSAIKEKIGGRVEESDRLEKLYELAEAVGIAERLVLDPSIARGLDYYTGVVFETFLDRLPEIGSICSGGRYDNLASLYTKELLPGVGASVGLDRLVAALEELGLARKEDRPTEVLVLNLDESLEGEYHRIAQECRKAGLSAEVYPENRKLGQQFAYAEKKGIPLGIIRGESEHREGVVNLRFLETRESVESVTVEEAIRRGREALEA
ncbi:MAG: histidine--tRNA ligase [Alkalispirochaetaceae bacterium]